MILSILRSRSLIIDMWGTELKRKYAGTLLGPIWAILPPILTVAAYWFVFELGLKIKGTGTIPYVYYFTLGILPWFLFLDTFSSCINAIRDNRHLITKLVFPSEILPVNYFLVASIPHLVLLSVLIGILWGTGLLTLGSFYWLFYFYMCLAILAIGLGWFVSSISVFSQDIAHFSQMVVGLMFWITPIMWPMDALPVSWYSIIEWNPLTYIVNGYRLALTGGAEGIMDGSAKFWIVTLTISILGCRTFKQLKHHFADVL